MSTRIKMPAGTSSVSVAGQAYDADEHGIVHDVAPSHIAGLVRAGGRELDAEETDEGVLEGFADMPVSEDVGAQEGEVTSECILDMARVHADLTPAAWNALPETVRHILYDRQVNELTEAGKHPTDGPPVFRDMTKQQLSAWTKVHGGTPPARGSLEEYIAAAEAAYRAETSV